MRSAPMRCNAPRWIALRVPATTSGRPRAVRTKRSMRCARRARSTRTSHAPRFRSSRGGRFSAKLHVSWTRSSARLSSRVSFLARARSQPECSSRCSTSRDRFMVRYELIRARGHRYAPPFYDGRRCREFFRKLGHVGFRDAGGQLVTRCQVASFSDENVAQREIGGHVCLRERMLGSFYPKAS